MTKSILNSLVIIMIWSCRSDTDILTIGHLPTTPNYQQDAVLSRLSRCPDGSVIAIGTVRGDDHHLTVVKRQGNELTEVSKKNLVFELGSLTSTFTTRLAMHYASQGLLDLDRPIKALLPYELNASNYRSDITIRHLIQHTSGLPRLPGNMMKDAILRASDPYGEYDEEKLKAFLSQKLTLHHAPGSKYQFSILGIGLLGYLLESMFEGDLEYQTRSMLAQQMGMKNTTYNLDPDHVVLGLDAKGKVQKNWTNNVLSGSYGLKSSAKDMMLWLQNHMTDNQLNRNILKTDILIDTSSAVSYGWHVLTDKQWYWHNGGSGGYTSSVVFDDKSKTGVTVLTNLSAKSRLSIQVDSLAFDIMDTLNQH